ncbi:helix-turn-helix transcriptional regulator [Candidatus Poribacteria bacterium]|jgi:transcriptional regulator with XRE-family HTH domain|nr:helix-turn-helix transcriptional regulator [Candidatus Poribacteria bacterium]MBT5533711.1 helix-turn-helix transcriptional regulator [Candidatus Poribacteria bacterium]MBT5714278.1 helix-turn-helix transcriptional regulator [Candidatus Poribacteria bacterium]MBT7095941.1 helix-turn-helix transcriptional regulator [Candidatus Poribacteria bacterium]MBT7807940.1 helix-turn-helix transcriptional regulator [Candidatus Poribacteria bacterium]
MNPKAVFGANVRRLRRERGFTQKELATRTGFQPTYVGGVERGERNISLVNMAAMAVALRVTLSELVAGIPRAE